MQPRGFGRDGWKTDKSVEVMNETLVERFGRGCRGVKVEECRPRADVRLLPPRLNHRIKEYFQGDAAVGGRWLSCPELPTSDEVSDKDTDSSGSSDVVEIAPNKPAGAFETKEEYLSTQYELLREDALRPLREAVSRVRMTPAAVEDAFDGQIGIYEKVHICAVTPSKKGIAVRVTFSLVRAGKKILWEQSKRLISGSLVVLTPKDDMFHSKAVVATVAARPLQALQQNPPEVDLFFACSDEIEIDPAVEFVMIEERSGFFEADRHTLLALQHMMKEPFPLSEHLIEAKTGVSSPPQHVQENPYKDLRSCLIGNRHETYENVNILSQWPRMVESELDSSQLQALRSILTKKLAIVQGPPGTGKTFVTVEAIKVMLANRSEDDPPIIIACQTNHAIDQILRHIAQFEKDFVRLGGRSKDRDIIKKRTLFEVRQTISENPPPGWSFPMAKKKMDHLTNEIRLILKPLTPDKKLLDHKLLVSYKILTENQSTSLESGASQWIQNRKTYPNDARSPFTLWLGDKLIPVPAKQLPEEFGFDYEEADLEFELLKELEAENAAKDDDDFERLSGEQIPLADNFTCRKIPGIDVKVKDLLKEEDMWRVPEAYRPAIYRYLQAELKSRILAAIREKSKQYNKEALLCRIGYWEKDETILKRQKVIGMTTTGFSKNRALIAALQPKIVIIEEAAETLEAPVAVTCVPSLQQLILVGDHKQLRPHTHVKAHEDKPFYLNISLFERMINNQVSYDVLEKQRRMIPEIRRILYPIYNNKIKDHPFVTNPENRPNVGGMGGVNSFFFTHQWSEQRDDQMSCYNRLEAEMIVGFYQHLIYNGIGVEDITVLTFYNGQRKRILQDLRDRIILREARKFNVVTVDSYQGEENKVVILSLVRSNDKHQIGFLNVDNRVCVALSRAQCGFYIFGNGRLLYEASATWNQVIKIFAAAGKKNEKHGPAVEPFRLSERLPIRCSRHDRRVEISDPDDWEKLGLAGGCDVACEGELPCGHACSLRCHPYSHDEVNCQECRPKKSEVDSIVPTEDLLVPQASSGSKSTASTSIGSWNSYTISEPARVAVAGARYKPSSAQQILVNIEDVEQRKEQMSSQTGGSTEKMSGSFERTVKPCKGDVGRKKWTEKYVAPAETAPVETSPVETAPMKKEAVTHDWSKERSLLDD